MESSMPMMKRFLSCPGVADPLFPPCRKGVLEYWGAEDFGRPPAGAVSFKFKMDTDLYDLAKAKTRPCSISFSPDGKSMAVTSRDKQVSVPVLLPFPYLVLSFHDVCFFTIAGAQHVPTARGTLFSLSGSCIA